MLPEPIPPYKKLAHDPTYGQACCAFEGGKLKPEHRAQLAGVDEWSIRRAVAIRYYNAYSADPEYPFDTWNKQYSHIRGAPIDPFFLAIYIAYKDLQPMGRRKNKGIQAKNVMDVEVIRSILKRTRPDYVGAIIWEMQKDFPDLPKKVLLAKLRSMIKRNLINGCTCGCRGDFRVNRREVSI